MAWYLLNDDNNQEIMEIEDKYIIEYKENRNHIKDNIKIQEIIKETNSITILTDINEILKLDNPSMLKKYNALDIIQMQIIVIDVVTKYFKISKLDNIDFYVQNLTWIYTSSLYLTNLIRQPVHKNKTNVLMRSSYKFCNKMTDCVSQYGFLFNKKCRNCINDHYVHNKIISDIDNLLNYLKNNCKHDNLLLLEQDMRKGIETLSYVLNHMEQELSSFTVYFGKNSQKSKYTIKDFYRYYNKN